MASPYDKLLAGTAYQNNESSISNPAIQDDGEENNEISTTMSVLAGIGSGLFKIPEGIVSLGATLLDLGADTNKAAEVEQWFAKINPFDEAAEATTAGKITELIVNIGVPGGLAFKAGSSLAKGALAAAKSGKYLKVTGQPGKNIAKGLKRTLQPELTGRGKAIQFGTGAVAGGVAEGIFVGDVEEAGTFGDLIGGPTEMDRGLEGTDYDPGRELLNRVKFGTEGALFTGLLGSAGLGIRKLRDSTNAGKAVDGKFNKWLDRWISQPLRSRGKQTQEAFLNERKLKGATAADTNQVENIVMELDDQISKLFPFFRRVIGDKTVDKTRKELLHKMNKVLLSSAESADKLKPIYKMTDDRIESISFGKMNKKLWDSFKKDIKKLQKDPTSKKSMADIDGIFDNLTAMRGGWGQLFTSMGKRLDGDAAQQFKEVFGNKVTTWLDSTYDVFKNRKSKLGELYTPSKQVMDVAKQSFKELYKKNTGKTLSEAAAQQQVLRVYNSVGIEKGFKVMSKSDPYFKVPEFFVGKSAADDAFKMTPTRLSELTGMQRKVIEKLYGKGNDAFQTILNGTTRLSAIVRRNEYFDNLLNTSNEMKAAGKTPIFANSADEAAELFGGVEGVDWKAITPVQKTKAGVKGVEMIDPNLDYKQTLRPLKGERKPTFRAKDAIKGEIDMELPIHNPLQTKYALTGTVDSIVRPIDEMAQGGIFNNKIYQNLILYPKATSQMAKTILSPFTHGRNFISAGAFSMANGIIPFADRKAVQQAWNALQVAGPGTRKTNQFYQKLLKLGVVNSQVQLGDLTNLLKDVKFGGIAGRLSEGDNLASYGLNRLLKTLSKVKKFSEDAYTAEDDFWKIFSFLGESKRLKKAYKESGLSLGQKFTDMKGNVVRLTDDLIDEQAADIVRNNIPNYAYVSEFIKGLRKWPVGNFVSFPAEILRTSTNIVSRGLDEIFYTTKIGKNVVHPFRKIGMQRLAGMAFTTAAVPTAVVAGASAIYDVTAEERAALRRYVADWSKNSTLVPIRDEETGKLKYIDFSHSNAYDTITRPIQTIINKVQQGEDDKDGIMDDFILGVIESAKELGAPFISESIWTEALSDLWMRQGRTREGFKVWNKDDKLGTKMSKGIAHLVQSQAPLNWKQLNRIGMSMKPINDLGRVDDRGRQYEFGNEALGIIGFRAIEADPDKAIQYKVAEYSQGARNSKALFSAVALRGGAVTPKDLIDAYINANRALFLNQKALYKDLKAAKVLKGDMPQILRYTSSKVGARNTGSIFNERFVPYLPSKSVMAKSQEIANELKETDPSYVNPLRAAIGTMAQIRAQLSNVGLDDEFPLIENPLSTPIIPDLVGQVNNMISPTANLAAAGGAGEGPGFIGQQNVNIDPASGLTAAEEIYFDPLEKLYRKQQRQQTNQTKLT